MEEYIKNIIQESFDDEVNLENEWNRLVSHIIKKRPVNPMAKKGKQQLLIQFMKYAAVLLLGACLSSALFYLTGEKSALIADAYKIITDKGEKSYLELPDGSKVWLNSCTTIKYHPDYGQSNRNIYLSGEPYFEVAKNKEMPFVVKASGLDITAVGTAFNVSAYADDSQLITTLFSGKVLVQPTLTKQQILLEPNQVAIYYKGRNKIETMAYNKQMFAQWRHGALSFDMMYLKDITRLLERNYNVVFRYENQKIKQLKFSGSFRNNEALSEILRIIRTNTSIDYQMNQDTITIK